MKLYAFHDKIAEAAAVGLRKGGRELLRDARERAPEDDGDLKKSARLRQDGLEATVKFTAPHSWLQHERLDYQHPGGGEAKFLENAALEYPLAEKIAGEVGGVLGG